MLLNSSNTRQLSLKNRSKIFQLSYNLIFIGRVQEPLEKNAGSSVSDQAISFHLTQSQTSILRSSFQRLPTTTYKCYLIFGDNFKTSIPFEVFRRIWILLLFFTQFNFNLVRFPFVQLTFRFVLNFSSGFIYYRQKMFQFFVKTITIIKVLYS